MYCELGVKFTHARISNEDWVAGGIPLSIVSYLGACLDFSPALLLLWLNLRVQINADRNMYTREEEFVWVEGEYWNWIEEQKEKSKTVQQQWKRLEKKLCVWLCVSYTCGNISERYQLSQQSGSDIQGMRIYYNSTRSRSVSPPFGYSIDGVLLWITPVKVIAPYPIEEVE